MMTDYISSGGKSDNKKAPHRGPTLPRMGAFAWQLRYRAHALTYYDDAFFDLHMVIVRVTLVSGEHMLLRQGRLKGNCAET